MALEQEKLLKEMEEMMRDLKREKKILEKLLSDIEDDQLQTGMEKEISPPPIEEQPSSGYTVEWGRVGKQ